MACIFIFPLLCEIPLYLLLDDYYSRVKEEGCGMCIFVVPIFMRSRRNFLVLSKLSLSHHLYPSPQAPIAIQCPSNVFYKPVVEE